MSAGRARTRWRARRRRRPPARSAARCPSLREYRPDLPERLAACVDACLDPEPELRPPLAELRSGSRPRFRRLTASAPSPAARRASAASTAPAGCGSPSSWRLPPGAWRSPLVAAAARAARARPDPRRADRARRSSSPRALPGPRCPSSLRCSAPCRRAPVYPAVAGSRGHRARARRAGRARLVLAAGGRGDARAWGPPRAHRRSAPTAGAARRPTPPARCCRRCWPRRRCSGAARVRAGRGRSSG